jgi:hypothetical protein
MPADKPGAHSFYMLWDWSLAQPPSRVTFVANLKSVGQFRSVRLKYLTSLVLYEKPFFRSALTSRACDPSNIKGFFIRNQPSLIPHLLRSAQDLESLRVDPGGVTVESSISRTFGVES